MVDGVDDQLLRRLLKDGRATYTSLAEDVGLSVPAVKARVDRLEKSGIIRGYRAELEPPLMGLNVTAFVHIVVEHNLKEDAVVAEMMRMPEILEIHRITGEETFFVKIRQTDNTALGQTLKMIQRTPGVERTRTSVVVQTDRETWGTAPPTIQAA